MCDVATTRIFLVENLPSMVERLLEYLGEIEGVSVVGNAATPGDAIDGILRTQPDLVLLDYQLQGGTGLDVLRGVRTKVPNTIFAVLTHHAVPQYGRACLDAGADYFLDKTTEFGCIRQIIATAGRT